MEWIGVYEDMVGRHWKGLIYALDVSHYHSYHVNSPPVHPARGRNASEKEVNCYWVWVYIYHSDWYSVTDWGATSNVHCVLHLHITIEVRKHPVCAAMYESAEDSRVIYSLTTGIYLARW